MEQHQRFMAALQAFHSNEIAGNQLGLLGQTATVGATFIAVDLR